MRRLSFLTVLLQVFDFLNRLNYCLSIALHGMLDHVERLFF